MLKERINFLCEKQNISRKELAHGLITVPHLSNILSGRYLLADDLAASFAERLDVSADYLLKVADITDDQLKELNRLVEKVILDKGSEDQILEEFFEQQNSFVSELTHNLLKACFYQKRGDTVNYQRLITQYLNFYLEEIKEAGIAEYPLPVQKAYFYFCVEYYRGTGQNELALDYTAKLLPLVTTPLNVWLSVQTCKIDVLVKLHRFDEANQITDDLFRQVHTAGALEELTALYLLKSAIYFNLQLFQEALIYLAKAEENLIHIKGINNYFSLITNNRIVMLLKLEKFTEAEIEVQRLEEAYKNAGHQDNSEAQGYVLLYRCEIALSAKSWKKLEGVIEQTKTISMVPAQQETVNYYLVHLLWYKQEIEEAEKLALKLLEFCQKENHLLRLTSLYELLADISEQKKKYKQANEYNKKVIALLKAM